MNDIDFAHLAHNFVKHGADEAVVGDRTKRGSCVGKINCRNDVESQRLDDDHEFPILWKRVFQSSIAPTLALGEVAAYCCVQFFASRQ